MYAIYINCKLYPFISWILSGLKLYETRSRNMLSKLVGKRVYLVETGKGKSIVRAIATIASAEIVPHSYQEARKLAMIAGTSFDIQPDKTKVFYKLENVQPVDPFPVPDNRINHGRAYTEF